MHTIDLLERSLALAEQAGIDVRREWLGDTPGGACRIAGKRVLYANLSLTAEEQLQQVLTALRDHQLVNLTADAFRSLAEED